MDILFDLYLKTIKPNFTILSIYKLKKGNDGFWLEKTNTITENCIVEYKYNRKTLKYLCSNDCTWPPNFPRRKRIQEVIYNGKDVTKEVLKFAGPRKCDFNPLSLLHIIRKPRLTFFHKGSLIHIQWCYFMKLTDIYKDKLFIRCS